jgi:2'-5' RNA ligase
VEAALGRHGFAGESRPWHPHLTIGRVFDERRRRREAGLPPAAVAEGARRVFGALAVSRIALMRSDLSPRGARYSELESAALAGSSSGVSEAAGPIGPTSN